MAPPPAGRPPHPDVLTPAEWRVLDHLREGRANAEIAVRLGVSVNTVRTHVSNMLAKLELPDRHALAAWDGQPRRRFSWLPPLPLPPIALGGSLIRGGAIAGGLVAAGAIAVAIVLANSGGATEARTNVVLRVGDPPFGSRLVPLDPFTGAPLEDAESLDLEERMGGPLALDGSLMWHSPRPAEPSSDEGTVLTALSGESLGFTRPRFEADQTGVVQEWTLPSRDQLDLIAFSPLVPAAKGSTIFAIRTSFGAGPDELWALDLDSDDSTPLAAFVGIAGAVVTPDDRLFVAVHTESLDFSSIDLEETPALFADYLASSEDYVVELNPGDGSELARVEVGGAIASMQLSHDGANLHVLGASDGIVTSIELAGMSAIRRELPPGGPQPGPPYLGPNVLALISPDGKHLYLAGTDHSSCFEATTPCRSEPLGFRVIELDTMALIYADPAPDTFAMSRDGRWLITALSESIDAEAGRGDGLKVIDADSLEVVAHLDPDAAYESVVIGGDGHYAYATAHAPGLGRPPNPANCSSSCGVVTVLDLERLEVIAEHVYDEPIQWLQIVE